MNKARLLIVPIFLILSMSIFAQKVSPTTIKCNIKGEVIDRPDSKTLILNKLGEDFRLNAIEIPIIDNKFEYQLDCQFEELYQLSFEDEVERGSWMPIPFIAESGDVNFTLHLRDMYDKNIIKGGVLNAKYQEYRRLSDSLFTFRIIEDERELLYKSMQYYSAESMQLILSMNNAESAQRDSLIRVLEVEKNKDSFYSEKGLAVNQKLERMIADRIQWKLKYVKENVDIISYGELIDLLDVDNGRHKDECFNIYTNIYKERFPGHSYTLTMDIKYKSSTNIQIGGKYIDIENPNFEGNLVKLSDQIKGKIALIDLWASWCGPCRRKAIAMIPVYEEYKDKGFTVVGVAREEEAKRGINAAKQDGYPWLNLLELKDQNRVWQKYGVGNSGGATFLVNTDGTILAINPNADEVKKILNEKLNL